MTKNEARLKYKKLRQELSSEEIEVQSLEIANNLLKLPVWEYSYFHLFLSITQKKEIDTEFILQILHGKDKEIVVSKTDFENFKLTNYLLTDSTVLRKNKYGIPEPVDGIEVPPQKIDVVFIPLLAFDEKGNRVGYGKGFYDRFLSSCSVETVKVGLSFFEAEPEISEISEDDIPLDFCVTPTKIYSFKSL
ncbi:5-formyltetrahydrofolate cyclo-ligase [Salinimicrobium sp. GXAS 041]|uniref:5-formyltetrahydrofolate cyclo-ligase n=1 Tax=Salinimicrobium sp. GXAS 041 TaxID=3400806 RepID=UPI003C71EE85